jgi:predicted PurR-regulated permease PerM
MGKDPPLTKASTVLTLAVRRVRRRSVPRRRTAAATVVAALLAALIPFLGTAATPAAAASAFTSTAVNQGSGDCLDDPNSQTSNGVQLVQYTCNSGSNQSWTFTPVSGSTANYTVTSFAGLCVDVSGRSTADNAQIIQ